LKENKDGLEEKELKKERLLLGTRIQGVKRRIKPKT